MHAPRHMAFAVSLSRIVAGFVLLAGVGACGYKGPLYMPPPPPPDEASVMPPDNAPAGEAPSAAPATDTAQ